MSKEEHRPRVVVLLSGGMDSCVCAALAARDYDAAALHVMYGQRTEERERRAFEAVCERLGISRRMVIRNEALRQIGGSALTDASIAVPVAEGEFEGRASSATRARTQSLSDALSAGLKPGASTAAEGARATSQIPVTYVPFRNAHFLAAAVSWAEVLGAEKILIGAVEQDSSGYPDCRPAYYRAFNEVIRVGTKEGKIEIVTPLIGMRKSEIVTLGLELGAPFDLTWSCYSRQERACGVCESCLLRLRAFAAAGARDPIPYETEAAHDRR
ncbi:MAG: 7-cyano-7-deazaguanine synthase QueC [Acidobacteriia bacterium]|nr:7-cyano-7-deazaguanine synthase QueC [Terriglobia bacterium]